MFDFRRHISDAEDEVNWNVESVLLTEALYSQLPLAEVATAYESELTRRGDVVCIHDRQTGQFSLSLCAQHELWCATEENHRHVAEYFAGEILKRTPPPWVAFVARCEIVSPDDMVHGRISKCVYGVQ